MIGNELGPFRIESELGSGGMGTVYRAEDDAGNFVALKIIHPHLLAEPGFFKRFLREAELGRKVVHRNVVRTLDADALLVDDKQVNFMVMEYVEGKSLRALLNDLGTVPETLLREIALQTAAGLGAIHAAAIVHRDIKPENILITDDQEIRIMDLGVAKLQEASIAITEAGYFAGSMLYAAPEQFKHEDVGPPSDLYSLGVLLYELATGQNPFRGDDAAAMMHAHLTEEPAPAHERNENVSLFFAELVATLLAKEPADRFASAEALRAVLEEAERSAWWAERGPQLQEKSARLPKLRVNRETKLHGRADDLQALHDAWSRAKDGDGNTVFLEGEAGIGKTRLLDAFLRGLGEEDLHVLYGSYPPSGGMGGLSDAVLGKFGEVRLADALAPYLTVTPSLVPAFAALIKHENPPSGAEPLQGDGLQAVVVQVMRALASEKPTIWILDDLHFAPPETRDLLLAMARAVEDHRVLLVATARPGTGLEGFSRLESFRRIALGRLGARDVIDLLEDAFRSEDLAERLGGRIARKSDGVPFFVFEMIRGLKDGQFIHQQPDGTYVQTRVIEEIEVPSAVKDLIEGRMRGLTEDQRAILDVGAVQGMSFEPALVAAVLEEKKVRVLRQIAEVERRFGLIRGEARSCSFDQNQIQEVLYGDLLPELRTEYHTLLAEAHAERCGEDAGGDDAVFLVHHHLLGSRSRAALPHLTPAFDCLERSYRNHTLLDLARRALEVEGLLEGKERVEVLLREAGRLDLLGRRDEERDALDRALALADAADDGALRAKVRQSLGTHFARTSRNEAAEGMLREALELARDAGDRMGEAIAAGNLGNVLAELGRYAEAREHHEHRRALAEKTGDRAGEAIAVGNIGNVSRHLGRYEEAREHYERHRALAREAGDRRSEANATGNLGNVLSQLGRYAEAQSHLERQRALTREIGDRRGETSATGNLGIVFLHIGRYAEAQEHFERQRALSHEIGYLRGEAIGGANLGTACADLGCFAEAQEHLELARDIAREIGFRHLEGNALGGLADLAHTHGDVDTARRLYEGALALLRELGDKPGVSSMLVALGRLDAAHREEESAVTHLDDALALALETGSPETILAATVERARLPGGNADAALAAFRKHGDHAGHTGKMGARFRLWELTMNRVHLEEAHRLLCHLRDHAPEDCRDSAIENVPLHREIMRAWEEHGNAD